MTSVVAGDPQHRLNHCKVGINVFKRVLRQAGKQRLERVMELRDLLPDKILLNGLAEPRPVCDVLRRDIEKAQKLRRPPRPA
jgi:hypothetical protein